MFCRTSLVVGIGCGFDLILSLVVFGAARVFAVTGRLVVGLGAFLGRFGIKLGLIVGLAVLVDGLGIVLILVFRRILGVIFGNAELVHKLVVQFLHVVFNDQIVGGLVLFGIGVLQLKLVKQLVESHGLIGASGLLEEVLFGLHRTHAVFAGQALGTAQRMHDLNGLIPQLAGVNENANQEGEVA